MFEVILVLVFKASKHVASQATKSGLVVRGPGSLHKVLGSNFIAAIPKNMLQAGLQILEPLQLL